MSGQVSADAVHAAASVVVAALSSGTSSRPGEQWLALAGACQSLVNTAVAAQDVAVVEVGRRERVWCEDGTVGERLHGPGTVTLDAADLLAPVLGVSHAQAQRRVEQAMRLAAGRVPVPAEHAEVASASGLTGLHAAMAAGHLDGYRAGVVAHELDGAPAEVADAVVAVAALDGHLGEDAPTMRRRVRRLLVRISPDLLCQRAHRARASTGLRRWAAEPGVDAWFGTFPSEDAATAWAAIERLAHDFVTDGTCSSVEQARGKELTDLLTGNATLDVHVVLTVPAATCRPDVTADDECSPHADGCTARAADDVAEPPAMPDAQEFVDQRGAPVPAGAPGAEPAASYADADDGADVDAARTGCAEDLVEVQGARPSEPMLVRRAWLTDHLARATGLDHRDRRVRKVRPPRFAPCDPLTGARLDAADDLATHAYRPGPRLAALVRARDGRCRFPGCTVSARFCDLDHVRPWPTGRTSADNLICLCRRHHRIKQAPGWVLRLARDGTVTLTDPTGRVRTTAPLNALDALVLRLERADVPGWCGADPPAGVPTTATASPAAPTRRPASPDDPNHPRRTPPAWSALETHHELHRDHHPPDRRCTSATALRNARRHRRVPAHVHDPPPF